MVCFYEKVMFEWGTTPCGRRAYALRFAEYEARWERVTCRECLAVRAASARDVWPV